MKMRVLAVLVAGLSAASVALAQGLIQHAPASVAAGSAFTIQTSGSGDATLYVSGLGGLLKQAVHLGQEVSFPAGTLYNAGHYLVIVTGAGGTESVPLEVTPGTEQRALSFLADPSRVPVGLHNGISGVVYVFDAYHNLMTTPSQVRFALITDQGPQEGQTVTTRNGVAWTEIDSAPHASNPKFVASVNTITSTRVIQEVPGDPCGLTINAKPDGKNVAVETAPIHDCAGNAVPDGTIVTFTETFNGMQTTVDAPVKKDVAQATLPSYSHGKISAASGVVAGNQIEWTGGR